MVAGSKDTEANTSNVPSTPMMAHPFPFMSPFMPMMQPPMFGGYPGYSNMSSPFFAPPYPQMPTPGLLTSPTPATPKKQSGPSTANITSSPASFTDDPSLFPTLEAWFHDLDQSKRSDGRTFSVYLSGLHDEGYQCISEIADSTFTETTLKEVCPGVGNNAMGKLLLKFAQSDVRKIEKGVKKEKRGRSGSIAKCQETQEKRNRVN